MARELNRALNITGLIFYGVGSMVGAGIYSIIGAAANIAGSHLWISFLLASIAAFITVLSYAELISMYHKAGAEYQFLQRAFPKYSILSFMAGYLIALNAVATSATVALAFAGYLDFFINVPNLVTAIILLVVCTAVNIAGIRQSTWLGIGLVTIEVTGLLIVIWTGFESGGMLQSLSTAPSWDSLAGIFAATSLIFFVYIGFEDVANLSEESKMPSKTTPRALIISVLITSVIYLLVSLAFIAIENSRSYWNSASPLSDLTGAISPWRGIALGIAALFATASTALISLVSISRMLFGMAREGAMPEILSRTLKRRRTPWIAALILFAAACLFLPLGKVEIIASVSSFGVLLVFIGVQISMVILRFSQPNKVRPFRVPLSIGKVPVFPCIGIGIILFLITQFKLITYLIGAGAIILGLLIYFFRKHRTKHSKA